MSRGAGAGRRVLVGVLVTALVLAATVVAVAAAASVPVAGDSMRPTLRDGDRVVVDPFGGRPRRFDVVVARFADDGPAVVKRVVAVPGDRLRIGPGPVVLVRPAGATGWQRVDNPAWPGQWQRPVAELAETAVPDGALFLLGDNPDGSEDSRTLGWAPLRLVRGTVWLRVRPLADAGRVPGGASLQPFDEDR